MTFRESFSAGSSKMHSTCPEQHSMIKVFEKSFISPHFWALSRICRTFARLFRKPVKYVFRVSRGTLWGNINFWRKLIYSPSSEFERKFVGLLIKVFWQGCHISNLRVQWNILGKMISLKTFYFFLSILDFEQIKFLDL